MTTPNTMKERFFEQFVEMHPMWGQDMHNPPLLYHKTYDEIDEIISFIQSEIDLAVAKREGDCGDY